MSQNVPTAVITRESTRLWSNQEWALDDLPGVGAIVEYESRFNYIWPKSSDVFVCVYVHQRIRSRLPCADFCAQLRGAPRSNPAQQRHAKGETVSHAEFIALLRVKAPKPTVGPSGAPRCEQRTSLPRPHKASR
jgi:hypothetical protein